MSTHTKNKRGLRPFRMKHNLISVAAALGTYMALFYTASKWIG
eukprot:jgi/Antlo1/1775/2355